MMRLCLLPFRMMLLCLTGKLLSFSRLSCRLVVVERYRLFQWFQWFQWFEEVYRQFLIHGLVMLLLLMIFSFHIQTLLNY
jgi:hypothetical protein